jgi:hypothetical protein
MSHKSRVMSHESQVTSQIWLLKLSLVRAGHGGENEVAVSPLCLELLMLFMNLRSHVTSHELRDTCHESQVMSHES